MDLFFPNIAYASLDSFVLNVENLIIDPLIKFLFALSVVYFLYGVFQFLANQENEEKKTAGKQHMLYGVIGITIMMGVWFILDVILRTINIPPSDIDPKTGTVRLNNYTPTPP